MKDNLGAELIEIDLGRPAKFSGVETQGRSTHDQRVASFKIEYKIKCMTTESNPKQFVQWPWATWRYLPAHTSFKCDIRAITEEQYNRLSKRTSMLFVASIDYTVTKRQGN